MTQKMPPKAARNSERVRSGKRAGRGPKSGETRRPVERSVAPSATRGPAQSQVNKEMQQRDKKELVSTYQQQLDTKQKESELEVRRTVGEIVNLSRDNDRIQKRQVADYGMTLDSLEELKMNLETTKAQNNKLYEDMANVKTLHDKLEAELRDTKKRYAESIEKLNELQKDSSAMHTTEVRLEKTEAKCQELVRNNRRLRITLLKHHIDPTTDAGEIKVENDGESVKTCKSYPVSHRRRKLTVPGRYGDMEAVRKINREYLNKGCGVPEVILDHVSPAYLGYYVRNREIKEDTSPFRLGVTLPRIITKLN